MFKPEDYYYNEKTHGHLIEYLFTHNGGNAFAKFIEYSYFEIIKNMGLFSPATGIRVLYEDKCEDGSYSIRGEKLYGKKNFSGNEIGYFDPKRTLADGATWEIYMLDHRKLHEQYIRFKAPGRKYSIINK